MSKHESENLVLVSGAGGWLGHRLVDVLINGLDEISELSGPKPQRIVRCLAHTAEQAEEIDQISPQIQTQTGDLRSRRDCERFVEGARGSVLFHTAGIIHPKSIRDLYETNVEGTRNLLSAAAAAGVRRAVVVSSSSTCGCNPTRSHRFDEATEYNPYMSYGRSKMQMEQCVQSLQAEGQIQTVIVRPPWFYGPFQPPRQTLFFTMIRDGKCPIVGDGQNMRSMAYIDNICQGLLLASTVAEADGKIYWIADERPYSMNEIVDTVEELMESEFGVVCQHKRVRIPMWAGRFAGFVNAGLQSMGWYAQKVHVLSEMGESIACSVETARRELRYVPTVDLREGMRRSIRWCLDHNRL